MYPQNGLSDGLMFIEDCVIFFTFSASLCVFVQFVRAYCDAETHAHTCKTRHFSHIIYIYICNCNYIFTTYTYMLMFTIYVLAMC